MKNPNAVALGKASAKARKKKLGSREFNKRMREVRLKGHLKENGQKGKDVVQL